MGNELNISTIDFGYCFDAEEMQDRLLKEDGFRLPNREESIYIDFDHQAIWISNTIRGKKMVMDKNWGVQIVTSGSHGLILVEKEDE